ncbi:MAG: PocR ligand-binding domain-containing protein, partial [Bacillales bacterium]
MNLQDVVDIDILQKIQDAFAESTGFAAITVDFRGKPITEYSNFSPFCKLVRNHPQFVEICYKCDAFGGLEAARKVAEAGYLLGFIIAPIMVFSGWKMQYTSLLESLSE